MLPHYIRNALAAIACIVVSAHPLPASAQTSRDVKVSGVGTRKCTEWQQWREARNGEAQATALEWAQGFIAGHNIYSRSGANSIVADNKLLLPLIDNYCQHNAASPLFNAVVEITQNLGGARINMAPKATPQSAPRANKNERES